MTLLSVSQVAAKIGISLPTAYKLINTGELKSIKIGTRFKIKEEDLDNYLNQ